MFATYCVIFGTLRVDDHAHHLRGVCMSFQTSIVLSRARRQRRVRDHCSLRGHSLPVHPCARHRRRVHGRHSRRMFACARAIAWCLLNHCSSPRLRKSAGSGRVFATPQQTVLFPSPGSRLSAIVRCSRLVDVCSLAPPLAYRCASRRGFRCCSRHCFLAWCLMVSQHQRLSHACTCWLKATSFVTAQSF